MAHKRIAAHRRNLGKFGETMAASFLERNGARIVERNVVIGRGEIDLAADEGEGLFAVEVKTGTETGDHHPRWNFTDRKADQVARLARSIGIRRVDLVTVVVGADGLDLEWHRRVA